MNLGIDAGGYEVKTCGPFGVKTPFPSDLGEYREMNLTNKLNDDEIIYEYEGKKGFAGMLARMESNFSESRKGETKAHEDAKLRVLIAIHRYSDETEHHIVVGQPIIAHNEVEKNKIKEMLLGRHELTVNGARKVFVVRRCEVAAEGASVALLTPTKALQRVIDIGSGTINFGTVLNMRFVDKESFTVVHNLQSLQPEAMARLIALKATNKNWHKDDSIKLCGGSAEPMLGAMRMYFPSAELFPDPITANARAFYAIGKKVYG